MELLYPNDIVPSHMEDLPKSYLLIYLECGSLIQDNLLEIIGSVKKFVSLVKNDSFLVRI